MSPLDFAAMNAKMAEAELEMVRAFRASADAQASTEKLRLAKAAAEFAEDEDYLDIIGDQHTIIEEIHELADELAIVATYRVFELNTKRLLRWVDGSYSNFTWPSFAKLMQAKVGVDIALLPQAKLIDELRLLNNAIKHEGKVTQELANSYGWTLGKRAHPLGPAFDRLAPAVPVYIAELARAVLPTKFGGNRPDIEVFPLKGGSA